MYVPNGSLELHRCTILLGIVQGGEGRPRTIFTEDNKDSNPISPEDEATVTRLWIFSTVLIILSSVLVIFTPRHLTISVAVEPTF
jgi:hypothetical protein